METISGQTSSPMSVPHVCFRVNVCAWRSQRYCEFGGSAGARQLDGPKFAKLVRDCGLLDAVLTPTTVDLVFALSKTVGARRLQFDQFLDALGKLGPCRRRLPWRSVHGAVVVLRTMYGSGSGAGITLQLVDEVDDPCALVQCDQSCDGTRASSLCSVTSSQA